jgi:hypothetical protein
LVLALATLNLPWSQSAAMAAGLDGKSQSEAKEATRLYRAGQYEEAARLFANLTVDHPDMPIFERSLGACFYYLHRPEPALSNLRNYLHHRQDVPADDKVVVDRWIVEMETLAAVRRSAAQSPGPAATEGAPSGPPLAAGEANVPDRPDGLDLSARGDHDVGHPRPIHKTWWFWTGAAAVVAAGAVTTLLLLNRSSDPCDGASLTCRGVK